MNEAFIVELAGRRWTLPHLPFRLVMSIQPALFQVYSETAQAGAAGLDQRQIEKLATAVWRAVSHVEPALDQEAFLGLAFSVADLVAALPPLSLAVGLRSNVATSEASPETGKSISTP